MSDNPEILDLEMAFAAVWGIWSGTTDGELVEIMSQVQVWLTDLRDRLPDAPVPDILGIDGELTDRDGWRREVKIHRDGAQAAVELIQVMGTRPGEWPESMAQILVSHTRRHGRPVFVAMVDNLTRLATSALSVIAQENGQQLPEVLDESARWLRSGRR